MRNIKSKLRKLYKWDYFPFFVLFIATLIFHIVINLDAGDDLSFKMILHNNKLSDWLKLRYMTWSSRLIIEGIMVSIFAYAIALWKIIDIFIIILLGVSISKIFIESNLRSNNWIIVGLIFIYPFTDMSSAGWGATTINYLWPLSLGIYSFVIIKKIFIGLEIKWYEYVCSTLALIFAANQEQMCVILLAMYGILCLYFILKHKSKIYIFLQTFLCLASVLFIISCPGNAMRKYSEVSRWFPNYYMLSLANKVQLGFSSSLVNFISKPNIIFIIFSMLIAIVIIKKCKSKMFCIIGIIPLASCLSLPMLSKLSGVVAQNNIITVDNFYLIESYIPIVLLGMVFVCTLLSLYFCFGNSPKAFLSIFILILGFSSRIIMGFSPTIWASSTRTFIFMYFSFIICSIMLYSEICKSKHENLKFINYIIGVVSIFSYINIVIVGLH